MELSLLRSYPYDEASEDTERNKIKTGTKKALTHEKFIALSIVSPFSKLVQKLLRGDYPHIIDTQQVVAEHCNGHHGVWYLYLNLRSGALSPLIKKSLMLLSCILSAQWKSNLTGALPEP